jgi:hypothetical protein
MAAAARRRWWKWRQRAAMVEAMVAVMAAWQRRRKRCGAATGIATSDQEKTMAAGAQMWQSEMFTEDQMVA